MLIHAMHRRPEVITKALFPFAISIAADIRNKHKKNKEGFSPIEKLTNVKQSFELNENHAFGSSSCVLTADLKD